MMHVHVTPNKETSAYATTLTQSININIQIY